MNGFMIFQTASSSLNDPRGPLYEWKLPDGRQITVCVRKKGTKSGGHYHKGEDPSKNPERIFIAKGKVKITFVGKDGKREEKILETGNSVSIYPYIHHFLEILEDAVIIEYRITHFDENNPDTFPVKA